MDKLLYIAGSSAQEVARDQALRAHNLANATTAGFRADLARAMEYEVHGDGHAARDYGVYVDAGIDLREGPREATGRALDVAIDGEGWLAVLLPDGREAYTRDGRLSVDAVGRVTNARGLAVLGDGGALVLPPFSSVVVGRDGAISIQPQGQGPDSLAQIDRLKLVRPDPALLVKDASGQIVRRDGLASGADASVGVLSGFVESSNVNAVEELIGVLDLARHFEIDLKLMRTAQENDEAATRLLQIG